MRTAADDLIALCCGPYPGGIEPTAAAGMVERELTVEDGTLHYWASASPDPGRGWMALLPVLSADHTLFNPQFAHFARR